MMTKINVTEVIDTGYENGYVECNCGWKKALGDGYNIYRINTCPNCSKEAVVLTKRKMITTSGTGYDVKIGQHKFFELSNGLVIVFDSLINAEYKRVTFNKAIDL